MDKVTPKSSDVFQANRDRAAPLLTENVTFSYGEARELVLDTYAEFSAGAGEVARRFFDEHWIDAPPRPHKRGGAFCSYTVPSVHPYVMLNFTARRRDVLTMAHELGHGLHAALAQPQGLFHHSTPLTLAETASVFGETLVFERLLAAVEDDQQRLALLADRIDGAIAGQGGDAGLGLPIARKLAELMGGVIGCESVVGQGSLYWFTLPAEQARANAPAASSCACVDVTANRGVIA